MKRLIALVKAVCGKFFSAFVDSRLLAEFPGADELIHRRVDHHPSDDPRTGTGLPIVGVL